MKKEDFKISLDADTLTISAEKKEEVKNENEKFIRNEYKFTSFKRSFTMTKKLMQKIFMRNMLMVFRA